MEKTMVIIMREYRQRVRARTFLLGTLVTPILLVAYMALPILLTTYGGSGHKIVVLNQSGDPELFERIKENNLKANKDSPIGLTEVVVPPDQDIDEVRKQYSDEVANDPAKAYIVLRPSVLGEDPPEYYGSNPGDFSVGLLEGPISGALTERRLVHEGFTEDRTERVLKPTEIKRIRVTTKGEALGDGQSFTVSYTIFFLLFVTIVGYGSAVMRGVMEEKQSRIIEVMVSSVKPFEMMMGKMIGIGLVGLTQYAIWILSSVVLSVLAKSALGKSTFTFPTLPPGLLLYFVVYFILGYFLFASLYAVAGSLVTDEDGNNQLQRPIFLLTMFPVLALVAISREPNSTMAVISSLVPYFGPTIMMLRISLSPPPVWQIALSLSLMVATMIASVWIAGKIYRIGTLIYGKKASLSEVGRWLRYS